jgi:hypothetical protein
MGPSANIEVFIGEHGCFGVIVKFDEGVLGLSFLSKQLGISGGVSFPSFNLLDLVVEELCAHLLNEGPAAILIVHIIKNKS